MTLELHSHKYFQPWSTYGLNVGSVVGEPVGSSDGDNVGPIVGSKVGLSVGENVGDCAEGIRKLEVAAHHMILSMSLHSLLLTIVGEILGFLVGFCK